MSKVKTEWAEVLTAVARRRLKDVYLPRIERCLALLAEDEIWWRPHRTSNSVGNLVLHLCGNVRQWIISGLGGATDRRERDKEFAARGTVPRGTLGRSLRDTVEEASRVLSHLSAADLLREYNIQKFRVTGLAAVLAVTEHFSHHAGQIIYITKMKRKKDLGFTKLPGEKRPRRNRHGLPSV